MSSPFKLIAVLVAAGFCVPAAFAADAVTSASVVPAALKTQDGAVLEGTKTLAAKSGDRLPDNVDAVTSASVVPVQYRQTDWKPSGFTDAKDKKRALFILDDPRHESVTYDLCVTAMKFFEEKGFEVELRDLIANKFNPLITTREEFYHAKDGFGKTPADVLTEQAYVKKADHIIFSPTGRTPIRCSRKAISSECFRRDFLMTTVRRDASVCFPARPSTRL